MIPTFHLRLHGKGRATRLLDPFPGIGSAAVAARERLAAEEAREAAELPFGT